MALKYDAASTVYERDYTPRVTLSRDATGKLTAVIEVEGVAPDRTPNAEERAAGITSLDPPTIVVRPLASRSATLRRLLDASWRAVAEAAKSTPEVETLTPADLSTIGYRVTSAVRAALRLIKEDV
jgi:hypothetical protein